MGLDIFENYGFPNTKLVGVKYHEIFFNIILRADKDYINRFTPIIKKNIKDGDLPYYLTPYLEDRLLQLANKPQKYGTIYIKNANGDKELYRHIEIDKMLENRKEYHLGEL